jgi:hypothetical protein
MENKNYQYGYYIIGFVDVLGQREKLRQLRRLPKDDVDRENTIAILKETAGYVMQLREILAKYFQQLLTPGPLLAELPPGVQEQFKAARTAPHYRGFSDSLVMTGALASDKDENMKAMTAVYGTIAACSMLPFIALSIGRPVRGGIDVGLGLEITPDEVYGPALERAHYLESRLADYPCVLVGDELWNYLSWVEAQVATVPIGRVAVALASKSKEFITTDADGRRMLDFLGQRIVENIPANDRLELMKRVADYIGEQEQTAQAKKNEKFISRYRKLRAYYDSRSALWSA